MAAQALTRTGLRVDNAANFINRFGDASDPTPEYLYIGLSGTTAWADEGNPPAPTDDGTSTTSFWNELIGFHQISPSDVVIVVPRFDWANNLQFIQEDPASQTPFAKTDNASGKMPAYCINSENNVYKVIVSPNGTGDVTRTTSGDVNNAGEFTPPAIEPTGHNSGVDIVTGDGYTWRFLYDMSPTNTQNMLNASWLPINWKDGITANQTSFGDVNAQDTLHGRYVMVRSVILPITDLPVNVTYRKIAYVGNPENQAGALITAANADNAVSTEISDSPSGSLQYMEHRSPITRNDNQTEEIKTVIEF